LQESDIVEGTDRGGKRFEAENTGLWTFRIVSKNIKKTTGNTSGSDDWETKGPTIKVIESGNKSFIWIDSVVFSDLLFEYLGGGIVIDFSDDQNKWSDTDISAPVRISV